MSKVCLILEGGGTRGSYTSGVLDAFLDSKLYFSNIYAVSAGALNALSYLSRQRGRSKKINSEYIFSPRCISYKRMLRGKSVLNLDYLLKEVNLDIDKLDLEQFNLNKEHFIVTCSDILNGCAYYKEIDNYLDDWSYIKASASLPLFTKIVKIDDLRLLDGGISDSIPIKKAMEDGYDKIVVILTRDRDFKSQPYRYLKVYKTKYFRYPKLIEMMENRYLEYNKTRSLIEELNNDNKIVAIYPSEPLLISNLEKNEEKISKIYQLGYDDAIKNIERIKEFIGGDINEK